MSAGIGGSTGAVVRQGHLRKLKTMKKKFFVLRAETADSSAKLEYYESEKKFRAGASPRRVLALKSCYNIMRRLDLKQKHVIALFTSEEQFCIVAENEQDLHGWLTAILKQHRSDETSDEIKHPIQHVWQVNVQKKGLGATKNIQGMYNLCLTGKTLTLVKIKSHNNVISDLGIPERVEYALKNIRTCGDSECFFYMEVGRQTTTGAGELWMHTDDSNIAQSMHSTVYHAMRNCARESENERDHIELTRDHLELSCDAPPARRQTYPEGKTRPIITNDAGTLRIRCDSMPSRPCSSFEAERPQARLSEVEGMDVSRDEPDSITDWSRTPRIPEEPDCCDMRDFMSTSLMSGSSVAHSRTSSVGEPGYLPMAPGPDPLAGRISASSGSLASGTPSTDPRFSEYQLEPATSHIGMEARPPRAYSVGSRPTAAGAGAGAGADGGRHRAYSVGAHSRPPRHPHARPVNEDHMEIDFSNNSPANRISSSILRTPPITFFADRPKTNVDEYVDMSPRNAGYVEMKPGEPLVTPLTTPPINDGYVEMNYGRAATRPIAIGAARPERVNRVAAAASPDEPRKRGTPHGSQTLFDLSLDSPAEPPEPGAPPPEPLPLEEPVYMLSTVRELSEDGRRSPDVTASPQYVTLAPRHSELPCNPTANKTITRLTDLGETKMDTSTTTTLVVAAGAGAARFTVEGARTPPPPAAPLPSPPAPPSPSPLAPLAPLNYAALDLEPRRAATQSTQRAYTKIDFLRSEQLHADVT